jgi:predicted  nucleic acid-binding Zn ribbon protein
MHVAQLTLTLPTEMSQETVDELIYDLLPALRNNGQINDSDYQIAFSEGRCVATVLLPALDALEAVHDNKYVAEARMKLEDHDVHGFTVNILGQEIESSSYDPYDRACSYILYCTFLSHDSPLRSGDDFHPIPLYTIPKNDGDEYWDIMRWQANYKACDTLQMGCQVLERAATHEMGDIHSKLSREGITICENITANTGIPTYYYLFRYFARSRAKELERKCPGCGGEWLLDEPVHIFDFRCATCRLLSNIAFSVR